MRLDPIEIFEAASTSTFVKGVALIGMPPIIAAAVSEDWSSLQGVFWLTISWPALALEVAPLIGVAAVIGVPEIFSYWLQAGRIDVGFLGAAQIDRFANLNTNHRSRRARKSIWASRFTVDGG